MTLVAATGLKPREAIDKAYAHFREFFDEKIVKNVLLEQLEFDENTSTWQVTIGFDMGREAFRPPSFAGVGALLERDEVRPIREARRFDLSDHGGQLLRMVDA
jgi:hypothetical protein